MRFWGFGGLILLGLAACSSPEQRFHRLQRDFLREFSRPSTFWVVAGVDTLALPLPPSGADLARVKTAAATFQKRCKKLAANELPAAEQARFTAFQAMLDSLSQPEKHPWPDPARFCVDEVLRHFPADGGKIRHPELLAALLEQLPVYYATVQENWPGCDPIRGAAAAHHSASALEQLDRIEALLPGLPADYRARLAVAAPPARWAIKDFIALCQSQILN